MRPDTPFKEACIDAGFEVHAFRPGMNYNPISVYKIASILKKNSVDIIIANISKDINIGAAARLCGIPVVRRVGLPQDIAQRREETFLAKLYSKVLVPSNNLKESIEELPQMIGKEIFVLPNSKKPKFFKEKRGGESEITIGVSSQLTITKGHKYLIDAFKKLIDKG